MEWIRLLLVTLFALLFSKSVYCGGTLSLRMIQYLNPGGLGANGHHCDGKFGIRMSPCDYVFVLCLDHKQPSELNYRYENMRVCPYGRIQTQKIYNQDHVTFGTDIGGTPNPIHLKFNEWPGSVYLKVKVYDFDNVGHWDYVDNLQQLLSAQPTTSSQVSAETEYSIQGRTKLILGITVHCDFGYFGKTCTKFCLSADSEAGHYECNDEGDKLCHDGWTGQNCDEATDECGPQPCLNGGHCIDLHDGFSCKCPPGFSGDRCETNVNDCDSSPCKNGGVCQDGANNYTCFCDIGYSGRNCEMIEDPCLLKQTQCENNGTCRAVNGTDYVCDCAQDYFGENCEFERVEPTTTISTIVTESVKTNVVVQKESVFGTSVRVMVGQVLTDEECDQLTPWIVEKLAVIQNMNRSSIHVRARRNECTGDKGETVTELVLYIQYSVEGMSKEEVDFIVAYIARFVERGFPYKLYQGKECGAGRVSAITDNENWAESNWLMLVVCGACLLVISLIIIGIVFFRRRKRGTRPVIESYACVIEPNDYEESVPHKQVFVVDMRSGTSAFSNDLYCQPQRTRLPSLPSEPCSDDTVNRESGFDEDEYYNADAESIYQSVE